MILNEEYNSGQLSVFLHMSSSSATVPFPRPLFITFRLLFLALIWGCPSEREVKAITKMEAKKQARSRARHFS